MSVFFYLVGPIGYGLGLYGLIKMTLVLVGLADGETRCEVCDQLYCEPVKHETNLPSARRVRG